MSKYGYNEKELRKTIITKIDKDGFHNRTVVYGKDSGESQSSDWPTAKVTFIDSNSSGKGYPVLCPMVVDTGDAEVGTIFTMSSELVSHENPLTVDVPLFEGACYLPEVYMFSDDTSHDITTAPVLTGNVTLSRNIFVSGNIFVITGDATITMASVDGTPAL